MRKNNTMLKTLEYNYDQFEHCKDHQDENRTDSSSLADDIDESIYKNEMMQPARKYAYHGNDYEQSRCVSITNREGCIEYDKKLGDKYFYRDDGNCNEDDKYGEDLHGEEVVETYKLPCKFLQTEKGVEVCHEDAMDDFKLEGKEVRNAEKYLNLSSSEGIVRCLDGVENGNRCDLSSRGAKTADEEHSDSDIATEVMVRVLTWNQHAKLPSSHDIAENFIKGNRFHIIVFCSQECQNTIAKSLFVQSKEKWERIISVAIGPDYEIIASSTLQAIHIDTVYEDETWISVAYLRNIF